MRAVRSLRDVPHTGPVREWLRYHHPNATVSSSRLRGCGAEAVSQLDALINGSGSKPLVLDADALTIISSDKGRYLSDDLRRMSAEGRQIILTPHEGELHRLLKVVPDAPTDGDRLSLGIAVSEYMNCIVVVKGSETYTIAPGEEVIVNDDCGNCGIS